MRPSSRQSPAARARTAGTAHLGAGQKCGCATRAALSPGSRNRRAGDAQHASHSRCSRNDSDGAFETRPGRTGKEGDINMHTVCFQLP